MEYWKFKTNDIFLSKAKKYISKSINYTKIDEKFNIISKTSFYSDNSVLENLYKKYLEKQYNEKIYKECGRTTKLCNIWYQVYEANTNSSHEFHGHDDCSFANVVYISLPNKELITEFIYMNSLVKPDVDEGDTLIFYPKLLHRSLPNYTESDKIVISFNTDLIV